MSPVLTLLHLAIYLGGRGIFPIKTNTSICRHSPLTYTFTERVQILASQTFTRRAACATLSLCGVVVSPTPMEDWETVELLSNLGPGEVIQFQIAQILWMQ